MEQQLEKKKKKKKKMIMMNYASHGKQMAQYEPPYNPIPTIHNFLVKQFHQLNRNTKKWKDRMKKEIGKVVHPKVVTKSTFQQDKVIRFVPWALFNIKPQSCSPWILTIGPLYQNLNPSPINKWKALCVKKFMERYGISDVEELMEKLIP